MSVEPPEPAVSSRRVLSAVGLTGSAALVTVALGVGTTKIVALAAGPAGIALMGLYRYLGALVSRSLLLGLDTTVVQRLSTSKDERTSAEIVVAAFLALVLQGVAVAAIGLAGAGFLGQWLFGGVLTGTEAFEIRLVLVMAYANLSVQVMTAILGGRIEVRKVALVGVVSAVATLAAIHPLLRLGRVGLALNVGSGSVAGAALATFFVLRGGFSFGLASFAGSVRALGSTLARSAFLILHPLVMMTAMVSVQALVRGRFALEGLGAYNAAMAILDTALMVITASARSFFLPSLGSIDDAEDKARAVNRVLRIHLLLASASALVAIVGAPLLIPLLFSRRFESAVEILPPFALALVGQAFVWSYAMFYLHQARYRLFFGLDLIWAATYVGATSLVVLRSGSLTTAAWVYAGSYCLSGLLYATVAVGAFGWRMLDSGNLRLTAGAAVGALGALALHDLGLWLVDAAVLGVGLGALGVLLLRPLRQTRAEAA